MISIIDTSPWTTQDQTGGGAIHEIVVKGQKCLYVFGNTSAGGSDVGAPDRGTFRVYKSVDYGFTWEVVASLPLGSRTVMFNPATALEMRFGNPLIHILGYVAHPTEPDRHNLVKIAFNPLDNSLSTPLVLVTGTKLAAAYGFVITASGQRIISTAALDPLGPAAIPQNYSMFIMELDRNDNVVSVQPPVEVEEGAAWPTPYNSVLRGGLSLSTTTLVDADGQVELYTVSHSKSIDPSRPPETRITLQIRRRTGEWSDPSEIWKFDSRYIDDKLTVTTQNQRRFLTLSYYQQSSKTGISQSCVMLFGFQDPNGYHWRGLNLDATPTVSWSEPMIQTDTEDNVYLVVLRHIRPSIAKPYPRRGVLTVMSVNDSTMILTPTVGAFANLQFRWLRGKMTPNDPDVKWAVVGEQADNLSGTTGGAALFVSKKNLAPHAILKPGIATARRGIPLEFDASDSFDPDQNTLAYVWTHTSNLPGVTLTPGASGRTASLLVPKTIGPAPTTFEVVVQVKEVGSDDLFSDVATATVHVDANVAPTITFTSNPISAARNTDVIVGATLADADADSMKFQWKQVAGTPVVMEGANTLTPTLKLYRLLTSGETLKFRLTASDDINFPVEALLSVTVPAIPLSLVDKRMLGRSFFVNDVRRLTVSERHTPGQWNAVDTSAIATDYFRFKFSTMIDGEERYIYVSPTSVVCFAQWDSPLWFFRRRITLPGTTILDAKHVETDVTFVLTSAGTILVYKSPGPVGNSDWPDAVIPTSLPPGSFNRIEASVVSNNRRVLVVSGSAGVQLIQVHDVTFETVGTLMLSVDTELLYGANPVVFVRFADLESLRSGRILVGTQDAYDPANPTATRHNYETLVDLPQRRITGSWDTTTLKSSKVWTGELLYDSGTGYMGRPNAPVITTIDVGGADGVDATLHWNQDRLDLIDSYEVQASEGGAAFHTVAMLGSGSILSYPLKNVSSTDTYRVRLRSINKDGASPWSKEVTHIATAEGWVEAGWVSPTWVEHKTTERWVL